MCKPAGRIVAAPLVAQRFFLARVKGQLYTICSLVNSSPKVCWMIYTQVFIASMENGVNWRIYLASKYLHPDEKRVFAILCRSAINKVGKRFPMISKLASQLHLSDFQHSNDKTLLRSSAAKQNSAAKLFLLIHKLHTSFEIDAYLRILQWCQRILAMFQTGLLLNSCIDFHVWYDCVQ